MNFIKQDNTFSFDLPKSDLIFTRYLYIKDEVRIALLVSILNKSDDAIFWAFELYYSGFKYELIELIWKIYYDFFATLNPSYEAYLLKQCKLFCSDNNETQQILVSSIIQDLLFRPCNMDIFIIRNIYELFENDITYHKDITEIKCLDDLYKNMIYWLNNNDLRSMIEWILNININTIKHEQIYNICLVFFEDKIKISKRKLMKDFITAITNNNISPNIILLSKIITLVSMKEGLKKGKSIYIKVYLEDIIPYETIIGSNEIKHYRILEQAYMCGIDDFECLSLFKLTRNKYNITDLYLNNWEYQASFSPVWMDRIRKHKGYIDYTNQAVKFIEEPDDEIVQKFYEKYGLEPDEQKKTIQDKSIGDIKKQNNWKWFYNTFKRNSLFEVFDEELEEMDNNRIVY